MRERVILGIDPGKRTGFVLLRVGAQAPFELIYKSEASGSAVRSELAEILDTYEVDGFAIEGWTHYGTKRGVKGTAQAAFAVGRVVGALEAFGLERWVEVTRPTVLKALGLKRNASKHVAQAALRSLTTMESGTEHEWDAAGVALAGAERFREVEDWVRA